MSTQINDTPILYPPSSFDRADGILVINGDVVGTPTPDGSVITIVNTKGLNGTFLEEDPSSPEIERSEQATITHTFNCDAQTGQTLIATISRGVIFQDSAGNLSKCLTNKLKYNKGGWTTIIITSEGLSFDAPPDEFDLEIVELNPGLEKHPRYIDLTYQNRVTVRHSNLANNPNFQSTIASLINTFPGGPSANPPVPIPNPSQATQYNEAQEELFKLWKGIDSFYLAGFKVTYSQYFYLPQTIDAGGYIQDPILSGILPFYFWNTNNPQDSDTDNTIFSNLAILRPTIYGNGISWLRLSDSIHYQRTWFKITRQWQGGPLGHWDNELYTIPNQPYQTSPTQGGL